MTQARMVFETGTTVIDLTSDLTNGNTGGGTTILDNSTTLCPYATATLDTPGTFGAAPTDNSTVDLYMVRQNSFDGTIDDTAAPTTTDVESAEYVGSFLIYNTDEQQTKTITISLNGVKAAYFYILNNTGQTITGTSSHIYVKIQPFSYQDA